MTRIFGPLLGAAIVLFARFITAARANWDGVEPLPYQRVYYSNHTSNADFILIWASLPPLLRKITRPIAGADYWLASPIRAFIAKHSINAVLIDRRAEHRTQDPIAQMASALDDGASLIIFPEGGRNRTTDPLLPFKAGLFNLAQSRPKVDLVPVWLENLNTVMPAGEVIPIPLICTVTFGETIHVQDGEDKDAFLARASDALAALQPKQQATTDAS
jgi:1-acyl-sn-glycerol-3-phosphate acyltransferase